MLRFYIFCFVYTLTFTNCQPKKTEKIYDEKVNSNFDSNIKIVEQDTLVISAVQLSKAFVENEIKADNDFKKKHLKVTGKVLDIKKGLTGNIFLVLEGSERLRAIQCYFINSNDLMNLKKGDVVKVVGECQGLMSNVLLYDCTIDIK